MIHKNNSSRPNQRNNTLSKSLIPLRNNSIRGSSMHHNSLVSHMSTSNTHNNSIIQPRVMNKPLTVIYTIIKYFLGKGNN